MLQFNLFRNSSVAYFEPLAMARAIENHVVANAVGIHPRTGTVLSGRSLAAEPPGSVYSLGAGEKVETEQLSLSQVARTRKYALRLQIEICQV